MGIVKNKIISLRTTALRWFYNVIITLAIPVDGVRLWLRARHLPGAHHHWRQRLGAAYTLPEDKPFVWLHAVSLGEVNCSVPLVHAVLQHYPQHRLLLTTTTLTGAQAVKRHFGECTRVYHRYFPYDHPMIMRRFMRRLAPTVMIIMETELWPNLLRHCRAQHVPVILANARLSARAVKRYRKLRWFLSAFWSAIHAIGAQTKADAARFIELGAPMDVITVCGNLKYEIECSVHVLAQAQAIKPHWRGRVTLLAASTHEGEESVLLDTYTALKKTGIPVLLVLVPRHPQRFDAVAAMTQARGLALVRRTDRPAVIEPQTDVLLVDTMGELTLFYAACDVAVVGGSLVPVGGHNLVEPAVYQCAMVTGSYTFNSSKMVADFKQAGAIEVVQDANALLVAVRALLTDKALRQRRVNAAQVLINEHVGALARYSALLPFK